MKKDEHVVFEFETKELNLEELAPETEVEVTDTTKKTEKKSGKKQFIVIGAVVLVIVLAIMVVIFKERHENTITITKDMIRVDFYGYNGFGVSHANINYSEVENAIENILEKKSNDKKIEDFGNLYNLFEIKVNKTSDLSNGDKVQVKVKPDKEFFKEYGIYISDEKFTIKVTDLETPENYIPLDNLTLYKVNDENGDVYYAQHERSITKFLQLHDFECVFTKKDDEEFVNVKIKDDALERLSNLGFDVKETERDFSINDVAYLCVANYDELPKNVYHPYLNEGDNNVKHLYMEYLDIMTLKDVEYYGGWIATYDNADIINKLVAIYRIEVEFKQEGLEPVILYVRCESTNVTVNLSDEYPTTHNLFRPQENVFYSAVIDRKEYEICGTENISDLYEQEGHRTLVFDPNGNIHSFK